MPEAAGSVCPLQRQPSNGGSAEQFPEFCLHQEDLDSNISSPTTPTASSPISSRSCSVSTVCTTPSSRLSVCSSLDFDSSSSHLQQLQEHDPWTAVASESSGPVSASASPTPRSRRDKKALQAARLQRSGISGNSGISPLGIKQRTDRSLSSTTTTTKARRFQRSASTPADALAAVEPPHDQGLARMAFAEQQRWITVQQKTFTKWLNTKIEARDLVVKDLVEDLSDGVSPTAILHRIPLTLSGYPNPSPRMSVERTPRPLCLEAQASSPTLRECQSRP